MIAQVGFIVEILRLIVHRERENSSYVSCSTRKLPELIGSMYKEIFDIRCRISDKYRCGKGHLLSVYSCHHFYNKNKIVYICSVFIF